MKFSYIRMATMIFFYHQILQVLLISYQKLGSHHHFFLSPGKLGECQVHFRVKGTSTKGQSSGTTKEDDG
jgi:hypothetical protein